MHQQVHAQTFEGGGAEKRVFSHVMIDEEV